MKHPSGPPAVLADIETPPRGVVVDAPASPVPAEPVASPPDPLTHPLTCPLPPAAVLERLAKKAKMGRLPDFKAGSDGSSFTLLTPAGIYDHHLTCRVDAAEGGSRLTLSLAIGKRTPMIAIALVVLTFFPGLYLTDSMLTTYFEWYTIQTWWWYVPMAILMIPVLWKQYKASGEAARAEATRIAADLTKELGGRVG